MTFIKYKSLFTLFFLNQVIPARQRDVLYCLHDAGSVSVKVRKRTGGAVILASPLDAPADSVSSLGQ